MGKFNIFEHIGNNLEKKKELKRLYNIDLNIDENNEPYLDVRYNCGKDGKNLFVGLKSGVVALSDAISVMESLDNPFIIPKKPIITVLYDPANNKYALEYGLDEEANHTRKDLFVVGYIINPNDNLNFEDKINYLYEAMVSAIDSNGFATVAGLELTHPIYKKDYFNQVKVLDPIEGEAIELRNTALINSTLKEKMGPQKAKK